MQKQKKMAGLLINVLSFDYVQLLFSVHLIVYLVIDFLVFIDFECIHLFKYIYMCISLFMLLFFIF